MPGESTELVRQLVAGGLNYADIGRALGRDRSLVRQVGVGAKPGNNLQAALETLRERLAGVPAAQRHRAAEAATVPEPTRRQTRAGKAARVRRPMRHEGRGYSVGAAKRQGARGGGKGPASVLKRAPSGREVAATASFSGHGVAINGTSGGRSVAHGLHGSVDIRLGDADEVRQAVADEYDGNLSAYVVDQLMGAGYVSADNLDAAVNALESLEVRTF